MFTVEITLTGEDSISIVKVVSHEQLDILMRVQESFEREKDLISAIYAPSIYIKLLN